MSDDWTGSSENRKPQLPSECPPEFAGNKRYVTNEDVQNAIRAKGGLSPRRGARPPSKRAVKSEAKRLAARERKQRRRNEKRQTRIAESARNTVITESVVIRYIGGPPETARLRIIDSPVTVHPPWPGFMP